MKRLVLLIFLLLLPVCARGAGIEVGGGAVEVVVSEVSGRTVRIEILPVDEGGPVRGEVASTVLLPVVVTEKLRVRELAGEREVAIGKYRLVVKPEPLTFTMMRGDGKVVQECRVEGKDGSVVFRTEGPVFGMGEGRQQFDRRGFFYNFINGQTTFLATHSATIPVPFLIGTDGWSMFIHNPPPAPGSAREANLPWGAFDLRGEDAGAAPAGNAGNVLVPPAVLPTRGRFIPRQETLRQAPLQIYLSALEEPADALTEYVRLTGKAVMPPKWVMGYMQSHRSLLGPEEPLKIAETFREKGLPCDAVIYLGSGYTNDQGGLSGWNMGHGSLAFNPRIFTQPQQTLDKLHEMHFKVILHKNAAPARLFGNSVNEASDDPAHISNYWATHVPLMKMGVDAWWPDDGDELPIEARLARLRLYYEGPLKDLPNERPWSLDRNGYAGAARYGAWIWSGDVQSRWETLANHVPVGLNFSLSISPFWGSDTGGFFLPPRQEYTGELWVRWFQYSAFTPLFRSHGRNWHLHLPWGWNTGEIGPRESGNGNNYPAEGELHNAEVEPICKAFLELRYRLLPYNYTLVREAYDSGLPPMRALWLHYPADAEAVKLGSEYLWGREMLVAPVVEKGAVVRRVYLPGGDWYDWWTGEKVAGGRWVEKKVDLATMPIYVRAGAVIPLDPVRQYTGQAVTEATTIKVYPGASGGFTLYDDDGHSMRYQNGKDGAMSWIRFEWDEAGRRLTITRDERMKEWGGGVRVFNVEMVGGAGKRVEFKGERVDVGL